MSARPPKQAAWFRYTDSASIGMEIVAAVVIGALGGYYLEREVTHWSPWTMLLGIAAGLGAAVKAVVRTSRNYHKSLMAEQDPVEPKEAQGTDP